jgi:CRISPR-associated RAMP protein (TIGR02581 family)
MLKQLINHARVQLRITPLDPLLIKTGQATVGGTDMSFVRTFRNGRSEPYLPGSSLKGVLRSHCEKICRTLRTDPVPVCLPYMEERHARTPEDQAQISCGHYLDGVSSWRAYALSCPACRLFGSLKFTGRCSTSDAYVDGHFAEEKRDGVAIDRVTGGAAAGAKYDLQVLVKGEFTTTLDVRNFERWQLGLLGLALADMEDGLVRLGSGKSRGLGRFKATVERLEVMSYGQPAKRLAGIGAVCSEEDRQRYDFAPEAGNDGPSLPEAQRSGLRYTSDLTTTWKEHFEPGVRDLTDYVTMVRWPELLHQEGRVAQGGGPR